MYAITDPTLTPPETLLEQVARAIRGGATVVQYRDKDAPFERRQSQATALARLCGQHGVTFIVNDDVQLARAAGAHGVHLGRTDASVAAARAALGDAAIVGVSCYNELARGWRAQAAGANYVAFGSVFASPSKTAAVRADLALLAEAKRALDIPVCAIGGIDAANAGGPIDAGVDMLAVIGGVFAEPDPEAATRALVARFNHAETRGHANEGP